MELLQSNYPPLRTGGKTFTEAFFDLIPRSSALDIAVGYITSDSLAELKQIVELNDLSSLQLTIGMHYFEKFTHVEYDAAMELNDFLQDNERGEVRLVNTFKYHGKLYSYSNDDGPFAGIIGSNNLSSIVEGGARVYESAVLLDDINIARQINSFICQLNATSTANIRDLEITEFKNINPLLEEHELVEKVSPQVIASAMSSRNGISFDIPIKPFEQSPKSNLNVFFGKGREGHNGLVKPRHWYEVELIVPKEITSQPGYPQSQTESAIFDVITDDGWKFKCKVSGDYSKNFRSEGDLKILGRWLKGRLENAGALTVGRPVTQETLNRYGRNSFTLTQTSMPGLWYLDFGV